MALHNLALPHHVEPPLSLPVVTRHAGMVLNTTRRPPGYRFIVETDGQVVSWLQRAPQAF